METSRIEEIILLAKKHKVSVLKVDGLELVLASFDEVVQPEPLVTGDLNDEEEVLFYSAE